MSEKEKRKVNPRRQLLIRLIVGIVLIVALVSVGIVALRPKGAQIVFIAPDDNGIDQIWLANLNDPEHPRQLTDFDSAFIISLTGQASNTTLYMIRRNGVFEIRTLNVNTLDDIFITGCSVEFILCLPFLINSSGEWVAYSVNQMVNNKIHVIVYIFNMQTGESSLIFETDEFVRHQIQWINESDLIIINANAEELMIYSPEETLITEILPFPVKIQENYEPLSFLETFLNRPIFSPDGSHYVNHDNWFPDLEVRRRDDFEILWMHSESNDSFNDLRLSSTAFHDWHPDNETILLSEVWAEFPTVIEQLTIYNTSTHDRITLLEGESPILISDASFNHDSTQILFSVLNVDDYSSQIMLYDMETREEVALPLFGRNPQWVNEGR